MMSFLPFSLFGSFQDLPEYLASPLNLAAEKLVGSLTRNFCGFNEIYSLFVISSLQQWTGVRFSK